VAEAPAPTPKPGQATKPAEDSAYESTAASEDEAAEDEAADGEEADDETADESEESEDGVVEEVTDDDADGDETNQAQKAPGAMQQRAESAVEGVIIGTVVGGQIAGGYGAAVGAAVFGLYGLITGDVPFDSGRDARRPPNASGGDADDALESEIEEELEKQSELEDEIENELKKQEEILKQIDQQEALNKEITKEQEKRRVEVAESDPLAAPSAPYVREIPDSIFDVAEKKIAGVDKVVKTLDADRDGRAEMEKVFDDKTGALESVSVDTNYDGLLDAQYSYTKAGDIVASIEDTDQDGVSDRWVKFEKGRGTKVEVDRNNDGKRDGFITYQNNIVALEEFDDDNDGKINRRVEYANRNRSVEMEDGDGNGTMDLWTYFEAGGRPTRIEKDTRGNDGKPDIFEYYEGTDPSSMVIVRKEEDLDSDGAVDQVAYYEKGKLSRKEILKKAPAAAPAKAAPAKKK
jgi:hypothetical protein